jgi:drug/metabolite transporter (DMT)-like permease
VMTALWPLIGASGMAYYSGVLFATSGLVIGGLLVLPFLFAPHRRKRLLDPKVAVTLAGMGFFSGLATVIYISALDYTSPANAAIMAQIEVIYSALLCAWLLGERIGGKQAWASVLVMAGTGLIMIEDLKSPRWRGDLMILATPWMYQLSHMLSKRLPKDLDPYTLTGGRIFYGVLTMLPFCAWSLTHGGRWSWSAPALGWLAIQGLLMSCLNFLLWYKAIRGMDLSKATAIMLSYPAFTVLFSWALGREQIHAVQLIGLTITLAGAYWVSMQVLAAQKGEAPARVMMPETPGTDLVP